MTIQILRTPEERFHELPDYPFEPHYVEVGEASLRMHHIDEAPAEPSGETILFLHGNPSWSYLYRRVVPPLVAAGHRCVAPDLIGFGKSDKLVSRFDYTYQNHLDWLEEAVFDRLDLRDVTLVCHVWGGALGLPLVAEVMNFRGPTHSFTHTLALADGEICRHVSGPRSGVCGLRLGTGRSCGSRKRRMCGGRMR